MGKKKEPSQSKTIALNRQARFNYEIIDQLEAGIVLTGSEVKSMRAGKASIAEAYADFKEGELYLINTHVAEYKESGKFNHEPKRHRKLLLHSRQLRKLFGFVKRDRMTLVPLALYFNKRGLIKVDLGICKGKKMHDKRQSIKERDANREKARAFKNQHDD